MDDLNIYIVSDEVTVIANASIELSVYVIGMGFDAIYSATIPSDIPPLASTKIALPADFTSHFPNSSITKYNFVIRATAFDGRSNRFLFIT